MERRIRAFRQGYAEAFRAAVAPFPGLEITVSTHVTTAAVCAEFDEVIEHAAAVLAAEGYTELATRLLEARDAARPVDGP